MALLIMIAVILPLLGVYFLSGGLLVCEILARRVAESPKGPVVAIGAICAGIGGLGKALGY